LRNRAEICRKRGGNIALKRANEYSMFQHFFSLKKSPKFPMG
jgi:hypothetical protein